VPYAEHLQIPVHLIAVRRMYEHWLGFIEAVALLRQGQNQKDDRGRILASWEDYCIAYDLMSPILARFFGPVHEKSLDLLKTIVLRCPAETFTIADCLGWNLALGKTSIKKRLDELVEVGFIEVVGGSKNGRTSRYKVLIADAADLGDAVDLINPDELEIVLTKVQGDSNPAEPEGDLAA
jgi:hypothetical protein